MVFNAVKEGALKKKASDSAAHDAASYAVMRYQQGNYHKLDKLIETQVKLAVKMSVKNATKK